MSAGPSLCIATPTYDARLHIGYVRSLFETGAVLNTRGISWSPFWVGGSSLVPLARNEIASGFLQSEFTHLLMVDSDISWRPDELIRLIEHDAEFVAAACPRRFANDFCVRWLSDEPKLDERGLIEVAAVGGGFMLLSRAAFERVSCPELLYQAGDTFLHAYFNLELADGRLYGEDYAFCHRYRAAGGRVLVDPHINIRHSYGTHHVEGCLAETLPAPEGQPQGGI